MQRNHLGEFEELVLLIVAALGGKAYGVIVKEELAVRAERIANISAVHAALRRLEEKGYIESSWSEATAERGGRRKRVFSIKPYGIKVLEEVRDVRVRLWQQIPGLSLNLSFS